MRVLHHQLDQITLIFFSFSSRPVSLEVPKGKEAKGTSQLQWCCSNLTLTTQQWKQDKNFMREVSGNLLPLHTDWNVEVHLWCRHTGCAMPSPNTTIPSHISWILTVKLCGCKLMGSKALYSLQQELMEHVGNLNCGCPNPVWSQILPAEDGQRQSAYHSWLSHTPDSSYIATLMWRALVTSALVLTISWIY